MDHPLWTALPADVRRTVDEHLAVRRHVHAIKAIRDASPEPVPGIRECNDLIADRMTELGLPLYGPTSSASPVPGPPATTPAADLRAADLPPGPSATGATSRTTP
ncbi:hypothetical protein AB0F71_29535 [Kitasatospora sp. NPDC028055]|uniref:hypothetical protein n=1 Tax=Kitasatospora sp. NPDC028055 TaxID=3155653 RepID=UPI0033F21536